MKSKILPLVVIASLLFLQPVAVLAVSYAVAMQTDKQNYSASDTMHLTGSITPPPGQGTSVLLTVENPSGKKVYVVPSIVNGTTGSFSQNLVLGGTSSWVDGKYLINGTWALKLTTQVYFATLGFNYTVKPVTTTTTTTTSTTSTTTTSTTTTSSTTSTTTTNSTSSSTSTSSTSSTTTRSATSTTSTTTQATSGGGAGVLSTINIIGIAAIGAGVVVAVYFLRRRAR